MGRGGGRCRSTECLTKSSLTVGMCTELTLGGLRILQTSESVYTAHEGLSLANQNSRKLRVFGRKLEGSHFLFIVSLLNITEIETIKFKLCFSINRI